MAKGVTPSKKNAKATGGHGTAASHTVNAAGDTEGKSPDMLNVEAAFGLPLNRKT